MSDFLGPYVRYSDPRIYSEIVMCNWGQLQSPLLKGSHSWDESTWGFKSPESVANIKKFLRQRGCTISIDGAVATIAIDHPPPDNLTERYVAEQGFDALPVIVLACTPFEVEARRGVPHPHRGIPVFRATVWGVVEGMRRDSIDRGLIRDVYLVGRLDVRRIEKTMGRLKDGRLGQVEVESLLIARYEHIRRTPRRAANTCATIAKAIPAWEKFRTDREKLAEAEAAAVEEAARLALIEEAAEDEGIMSLSLADL